MGKGSRSGRLADSRFFDAKLPKKKKLPHQLHWFRDEDYLSDEVLGVFNAEMNDFKSFAYRAFETFQSHTDYLLSSGNLSLFGLPPYVEEAIRYSWQHRKKHPFLYGRFDINGILQGLPGKVIEFNADTCSTLPETIIWHPHQVEISKLFKSSYFNDLKSHFDRFFARNKNLYGDHQNIVMGSSLGYKEDVINTNMILDSASKAGLYPVYANLEDVQFNENEGIFYQLGDTMYQADMFVKFFPWDFAIHEEPELGQILCKIITQDLATVLNPIYTTLWQNKKFMASITEKYPNDFTIAKTYLHNVPFGNVGDYVEKPILGRLGENVKIVRDGETSETSEGDYGMMEKLYQEYIENAHDEEDYFYQAGMFITEEGPAALNLRCAQSEIITDDCEFFGHVIL